MKQQSYNAIEVGETFGPVDFFVDDHFIKGFAFAVDDFDKHYFTEPGVCGPLAHSSGIAKKLLHIFMEVYDPQGIKGVHIKEDVWYHSPVQFDEYLSLSGRYVDKFVKKGRGCAVLESEARDSHGKLIVSQRSVEIIPSSIPLTETDYKAPDLLSSRRVSGEWPEGREQISRVTLVENVDSPLPVIKKTIHQDQMSMFVGANENWKNLHTDLDIAKEAGFETTIMSGMIQVCWFSQMLINFFGIRFLSGGQIGTTFLTPVKRNDTIELRAVVRSLKTTTVEIEFWSLNEDGEMTAAGWAIGPR